MLKYPHRYNYYLKTYMTTEWGTNKFVSDIDSINTAEKSQTTAKSVLDSINQQISLIKTKNDKKNLNIDFGTIIISLDKEIKEVTSDTKTKLESLKTEVNNLRIEKIGSLATDVISNNFGGENIRFFKNPKTLQSFLDVTISSPEINAKVKQISDKIQEVNKAETDKRIGEIKALKGNSELDIQNKDNKIVLKKDNNSFLLNETKNNLIAQEGVLKDKEIPYSNLENLGQTIVKGMEQLSGAIPETARDK